MKKVFKKALSVMLVVVIMLTAAPLSGFVGLELPEWLDFSIKSSAAETSGICGENITWIFDELTGTLIISGTGAMEEFNGDNRPWESDEDNIMKVVINNGITTIGDLAFAYCDSLTSVTMPDSVTTIGDYAFYSCTSLTNIIIPDSVITIGFVAFAFCESLTSVTIPNSVTTINASTFARCDSLINITIPDSVTLIGADAFNYCENLESVTIPNSVMFIGQLAFCGCTSLTDVYYSGTEEQWNEISIGSYNEPIHNATIHFNSTGGNTESDKYIGLFTTERSLTVGVNEKFSVAFSLIENGELIENWKKMSVVVSDPSIISLSDYKETDHGFMLEVTGKEPGVTNVVVTDTETGINTTFEIGVYDEYGQTRTYDMKNMPLFTKGLSKTPTCIYYMNGLSVNNFDYKEDGEYYNVTFDVYNSMCGFGAVDIFDEKGKWVGCEKIEPNKQIESMWDWLEESYYLVTDIATGKFLDYTSEFFSKKTEIDIKVPIGGYFTISNNFEASRGTSIYLFCEIFTKAVGKILPALGVEATEDQFMRDIVGAIVAEAYQDATLDAACGVLTKEAIKLFTKFSLSNVIDTSVEMVNVFENFLNALDISWKHIAKMTVSGAESVLSKMFTSIGTPLKAGFTASEINNWYEIFDNVYSSLNKTYASIYTDMDNIQNIDGIEVITNGKIDVDTALQVFKIYNNESAEENANGNKYELYNISFVKNDKTIQPSGLVEVRIPIPKGMKKDTCEIHRQEEDGSWTILTARVEGNYLVFETDHFSLYMISGDMYSLNIESLPDKITYTQGEIFDSTGLVLELNGEYITEGLVASPSVMETVGTQKVQIHYGAQSVEIDVEVMTPEPEYNYTFYIQQPSRTEIRNRDTIVLHAIIDGTAPEGSYIDWDMSEGNFSLGWDSDTDVYATAEDKGWDTITAILYDADGNELARDSVDLYSKSGFFDKIGGFFRMLFGTTKIYYD